MIGLIETVFDTNCIENKCCVGASTYEKVDACWYIIDNYRKSIVKRHISFEWASIAVGEYIDSMQT